jgi:hypothetical protein
MLIDGLPIWSYFCDASEIASPSNGAFSEPEMVFTAYKGKYRWLPVAAFSSMPYKNFTLAGKTDLTTSLLI